jgi:hypothetical protein
LPEKYQQQQKQADSFLVVLVQAQSSELGVHRGGRNAFKIRKKIIIIMTTRQINYGIIS